MTMGSFTCRLSRRGVLAGALIAAGALSACSPGGDASPAATAPPTAVEAAPADGVTAPPAGGETAPPGGSPTPTAEPEITIGWPEYTSPELGLTFLIPEGWQAAIGGLGVLDLRETDGEGWIQVRVLDADSAGEFGFAYEPGADAAAVLDALLAGLREDGDFSAPRTVDTKAGEAALIVEGRYYVLDERLLVGVMAFGDRAVVFTGHGPEGPDASDGEWGRLAPIYEAIIGSTSPAEE
jgi:hypothetical protein